MSIIKLVKSLNSATKKQKDNARSLNLQTIGDVNHVDLKNASIVGRINIIRHLIIIMEDK